MDYKRLNVLDKRAANRGANPYVDEYTGFTWNGLHSSNFNCFIENTGHLEFVGAPDFSNNFISPAFQTRTYYTGTASQSKKFQLNLVFYRLTLAELNAALHWLDRSIISDLYFDYEPYWKYSCKLASIGAIKKYPSGRAMYRGRPCDLYLCRVPITFETVYHPEAISAYTVFKTTEQESTIRLVNGEPLDLTYSQSAGADYMPFKEAKSSADFDNISLDTSGNQERYIDRDGNLLKVGQVADNWNSLVLIQTQNLGDSNSHYWRVTLYNPSSHSTTFKLHFFRVTDTVDVWQVWNGDYAFNTAESQDIDAYTNSLNIVHIDMDLDDQQQVNLHYNSEDGTVLMANQLVESVRGVNLPLCTYKSAVANVLIPGAIDSDNPASIDLEIQLGGAESGFAVEYDTYEYTV